MHGTVVIASQTARAVTSPHRVLILDCNITYRAYLCTLAASHAFLIPVKATSVNPPFLKQGIYNRCLEGGHASNLEVEVPFSVF